MLDDIMAKKVSSFVVDKGYVRAVISARTIDLGYGVAIEVFGRLPENCWKEALRYDCFEREPHWHRFPAAGGAVEEALSVSSVEEGVSAAAALLRSDLADWMERLGYPKGSEEASRPGFAAVINQIEELAAGLAARKPERDEGAEDMP